MAAVCGVEFSEVLGIGRGFVFDSGSGHSVLDSGSGHSVLDSRCQVRVASVLPNGGVPE